MLIVHSSTLHQREQNYQHQLTIKCIVTCRLPPKLILK